MSIIMHGGADALADRHRDLRAMGLIVGKAASLRYIGAKTLVVDRLGDWVRAQAPDAKSLCDPFAGTCSVSRYFKSVGYQVETGDLMRFSFLFQLALIGMNSPPIFERLARERAVPNEEGPRHLAVLRYLMTLAPQAGYFTRNFAFGCKAQRAFFTYENAAKLDAMRQRIGEWDENGLLDQEERAYLLTALINGADKVANTAGTYYAFLKSFDRKALKPIVLEPPPIADNGVDNSCHLLDARQLSAATEADILYLDPPYNVRDYSRYYHLPETLARGDQPEPKGASGAPAQPTHEKSAFCRHATAGEAFREIVQEAKSPYILMHYATNGLIDHDEILEIMSSAGETRFEDLHVRAYSTARSGANGKVAHRIYWCAR